MFEFKNIKKPAAAQPARKVHNVFASSMKDEEKTETARPKLNPLIAETSHQKMLDETSKYVLEDPEIFSYDAHYDELKSRRQELESQKKQQKQGSKYINNILKASEKRKIEQSMIYEKIAENELKREGENATDQKYVTASYKRMMEEGRKFQEEDAAKEEYNKQHTSENKDNILGLYKNLYQQDVFMGGYRPDIGNMVKQPQAAAPQEPTPIPTQEKPQIPSQTSEVKLKEATVKPGPTLPPVETKSREQERRVEPSGAKERKASRSRSRSRSKSPLRRPKEEEEKKEKVEEKEKEKELSKEEKLKLMKERYMQRKAGQAAGPAAPGPSE